MNRVAVATLLAALAGVIAFAHVDGAPARSSSSAQDPQFHAGTNIVSIYATVADESGRLVPDLTQRDFEVYDDGRLQPLTQFANTVQPITVVVMIDRSVSMAARFELERAGAVAFVANLIPGDRARIGSFNGMIRIDPEIFSGDHDELIRILYLDLPDAGLTPLWNATTVAMNALGREPGRRVVLLFTDGEDNPGLPGRKTDTFLDVRNRAQADDIMVYAVGIGDECGAPSAPDRDLPGPSAPSVASGELWQRGWTPPPPGGGPDNGGVLPPPSGPPGRGPLGAPVGPGGAPIGAPPGPGVSVPASRLLGNGMGERRCSAATPNPRLKDLAADGGGGYLELHPGDDLAVTFGRIADELHHQYLLGFAITKLDGRVHALDVRTHDPKLRVRARSSYVATAK